MERANTLLQLALKRCFQFTYEACLLHVDNMQCVVNQTDIMYMIKFCGSLDSSYYSAHYVSVAIILMIFFQSN